MIKRVPFLVVLVVLLLCNSPVGAIDGESVLKPLYDRLHKELMAGNFGEHNKEHHIVLLSTGGLVVDPNVDINPHRMRADVVNAIADVLLPRGRYVAKIPGTISHLYKEIVSTVVPVAPQTRVGELEAENEKLRLEVEDRKLESAGLFRIYRELINKLDSAVDQCANAQETYGESDTRTLRFCRAVERAKEELQRPDMVRVRKFRIEQKRYLANDTGLWLALLDERVNKYSIISHPYRQVNFFPAYRDWFKAPNNGTHITVEINQGTRANQASNNNSISSPHGITSRILKGPPNFDCIPDIFKPLPKWCIDPTKIPLPIPRETPGKQMNIKITFDLLAVSVRFPWLDLRFFQTDKWTFSENHRYATCCVLSHGGQSTVEERPKTELLPLVPVRLLVARNFKIEASSQNALDRVLDLGTVGAFSIRGKNVFDQPVPAFQREQTSATISFTQPQVIGYLAISIPESPSAKRGSNMPKANENVTTGFSSTLSLGNSQKRRRLQREALSILRE